MIGKLDWVSDDVVSVISSQVDESICMFYFE